MEQAPRLTVSEAALMRMLRDVLFRPEMGRPRDWGELEALTALAFTEKPVLAIGAELDRAIPPEAARRIAITAPNGELLMFEGCGHFPFAEAARALLVGGGGLAAQDGGGQQSRVKRLSASSRSSTASPASASASTGAPSRAGRALDGRPATPSPGSQRVDRRERQREAAERHAQRARRRRPSGPCCARTRRSG